MTESAAFANALSHLRNPNVSAGCFQWDLARVRFLPRPVAKASNETLYNWYGDKKGLFKALVRRNAKEVKTILYQELTADRDALDILTLLGPRFLGLLLGVRAIALNRAAAADASGALGKALAEAGRNSVLPPLSQVFERAGTFGHLTFDRADQAVALYLDLLVGDRQIRCVIGTVPAPSPEFCEERSQRALKNLKALLG